MTKVEANCLWLGAFDAIAGINSGGFMLARYLSMRLGIDATYHIATSHTAASGT